MEPIPLAPRPPDVARVTRTRGRRRPRAIAWFGFTSFWGHLRHLLASAIATDSVDSRQWMIPDPPMELLGRMIAVLGPRGARDAGTLATALGGEVWIDFVADTGDDVSVSEAVARLVAGEYVARDEETGESIVLPRAEVLVHGGDLAYPVATVREIARRLVDPFNRVLEPASDASKPRVLLGVPGNHDWYDGLDGFARLCQAPCTFEEPRKLAEALHPMPDENPVLAWAEAFASGEQVKKPGAMAFAGYVPVQHASYFRFPLARGVDLFGVDRQLRRVDERQRAYFKSAPGASRVVVLPDPARGWGEARPHGVATLASLGVDPSREPSLVVAGDVHHYERSREGPSVHVVAGGGGAFLQGARVARGGAAYERDVEFPGPRASWAMARRLPLHLARGGAGWVISSVLAVANAVALDQYFHAGARASLVAALVTSAVAAVSTALLVGDRRRITSIVVLACVFGLAVGALPVALGIGADIAGLDGMRGVGNSGESGRLVAIAVAWLVSTLASGAAFGAMLATLVRLGLNHAQPFAALGEPGFKHFVRMRVREPAEGPVTIDAFVVGVVDPLGAGEPVLVDRFRWSAGG